MNSWAGKVLIVDDDAPFRVLVSHLLDRAGFAVVEAAGGEEGLAAAARSRPDAVILDVALPDIGGFELCLELRDRLGDEVPVIFVSGARVEPHDRAAGLLLGGDDYLVKPVDPDELLARVRRALSRSRTERRESYGEPTHGLTGRELEVLRLLAQGLDARAIARKLVISPKTVSSHLQRVMAKLDVHSRAQAVARAYEGRLISVTAEDEADAAAKTPAPSVLPGRRRRQSDGDALSGRA
jgi:DNA-binding NarL/FixJ family response regulator